MVESLPSIIGLWKTVDHQALHNDALRSFNIGIVKK